MIIFSRQSKKEEKYMKKIILCSILIITAQAVGFKYDGIYHSRDSTITIKEKKTEYGDVVVTTIRGNCNLEANVNKREIKKNRLIYTEDIGYGPLVYLDLKFKGNVIDAEFSDKYIADSGCGDDNGKKFSGKYIKK
jgi:hypothetical protein